MMQRPFRIWKADEVVVGQHQTGMETEGRRRNSSAPLYLSLTLGPIIAQQNLNFSTNIVCLHCTPNCGHETSFPHACCETETYIPQRGIPVPGKLDSIVRACRLLVPITCDVGPRRPSVRAADKAASQPDRRKSIQPQEERSKGCRRKTAEYTRSCRWAGSQM